MTSKDEILANFQACSGIEDYGEALTKLEECNWNLLDAVNSVLPQDTQMLPNSHYFSSTATPSSSPLDLIPTLLDETPMDFAGATPSVPPLSSIIPVVNQLTPTSPSSPLAPAIQSQPSTSKVSTDVMHIHIKVLFGDNSDGSTFPLEIPQSTTYGELRTMLHHLVGITPCKQIIEGFRRPVDENTVITPTLLPENKIISLNALPNSAFKAYNPYENTINGAHSNNDYLLLIHDETGVKDYRIEMDGSTSIRDIKQSVFDLTSIPPRHQQWTGWPPNITDDNTSLAASGIGRQHHLTVKKVVRERTPKVTIPVDNKMEENSSGDEYSDAAEMLNDDDDIFDMDEVATSSKPKTLIPASIDDDLAGVIHFIEEFTNRYGHSTPMFFEGTLDNALKESVHLPAKRKKLFALYLHDDNSVSANVFCSQVLCDITIVDYLTNNFIIWGWDLTHEANKARLLNLVMNHFGSIAASTVRNLSAEKLPALLVITRTRGTCEVLSIVHGNWVLDEAMTELINATEMFEDQRLTEVQEEDAREEREAMKAEQDAAYMASLEADRAKAAAKQKEQDDKRQERERVESVRHQEEMIKEAVRASLETNIPDEPGPDTKEPVCKFRFRIPGGELLTRAFLCSTKLEIVLNYLHVKGYPASDYKCLQSWPRRDITTLDASKDLTYHKFPLQETLNLEER